MLTHQLNERYNNLLVALRKGQTSRGIRYDEDDHRVFMIQLQTIGKQKWEDANE
jgi:hypothetical protein